VQTGGLTVTQSKNITGVLVEYRYQTEPLYLLTVLSTYVLHLLLILLLLLLLLLRHIVYRNAHFVFPHGSPDVEGFYSHHRFTVEDKVGAVAYSTVSTKMGKHVSTFDGVKGRRKKNVAAWIMAKMTPVVAKILSIERTYNWR